MKAIFSLLLLTAFCLHAADYTTTQAGNWSDTATWGGSGPPGIGDLATLAHNVAVDVNTTVGTSPNNTTTNVIIINGSRFLTVNANVTLTVRGNISWANGSGVTNQAGSNIIFDNSASGGSPIYRFNGVNINILSGNGVATNRCGISAIAGQTWLLAGFFSAVNCNYMNFTRMAASTFAPFSGTSTYTNCIWDTCGQITFSASGTTISLIIADCISTNSTANGTTDGSWKMELTGTLSSGTRGLFRNRTDKFVTYLSQGFTIRENFFGGGISCASGANRGWADFRHNFVKQDGALNAGNGAIFNDSTERNYFVNHMTNGNPHFVAPEAKQSRDNVLSQNIFEAHAPDTVDIGDCVILLTNSTSGGFKIVGKNNIVLPNSYTNPVTSGTMLTIFSSLSTNEWYRNTANINQSFAGGSTTNGMFSVSEGTAGIAAQVAALKSNLAWGSSSDQGFLAMRQVGDVKDIITAASADYNWRYNSRGGDNQRGYEDKAANNTFWTAGDAVAASVDTHQGSGDPQFYDSSRNIASWSNARGYGSTFTNGIAALQGDPSRIVDLVRYIFEGYRPGNASCRNAAHDGGCVGAANYYKSSRTTNSVYTHRQTLSKFTL